MRQVVQPAARPLSGSVRVPGDKSISHRAVLFAAMSDGSCRLEGVLDSADVRSTIDAVAALEGTELDRARSIWRRRFGVMPQTAQERGRQARFLQSRGFSMDTIRKVLRELPGDD